MDKSKQKPSSAALEQQLVKDLEAMRDSLTHLSLVLSDLKFMVDAPQQKVAQEIAADCIQRNQSP